MIIYVYDAMSLLKASFSTIFTPGLSALVPSAVGAQSCCALLR